MSKEKLWTIAQEHFKRLQETLAPWKQKRAGSIEGLERFQIFHPLKTFTEYIWSEWYEESSAAS